MSSTFAVLWLLIGLAVFIANTIENYQKKRYMDTKPIEEELVKSKVPYFIKIIFVALVALLIAIVMIIIWPVNAYVTYKVNKGNK